MILVLSLILAFAAHLAGATISVAPSSPTVLVGDSVEVAINIAGLAAAGPPSVGAFDLDLSFDQNILLLSSASFGAGLDVSGLGSLQEISTAVGEVNLVELSLDLPGSLNALQPDAFTLASVTFSAIAAGNAGLNLNVMFLGDAEGGPLPAEIENAELSAKVPEPATWTLLLTGTAAFLRRELCRRKKDGRSRKRGKD